MLAVPFMLEQISLIRNALTMNLSFERLSNLWNGVSILSFLSLSSSIPSYHDNAGVLQFVNPMIGTHGLTPNGNGGMIPSVSSPFGMTRWTPQSRYARLYTITESSIANYWQRELHKPMPL